MLQLLTNVAGANVVSPEIKIPPLGHETSYPLQFVTEGTRSAGGILLQVSPTCTLDDWVTLATITSGSFTVTVIKDPMVRARAKTDGTFAGSMLVLLEHGSGEY